MKLGLHIPDYTWPGGPDSLGHDLARVGQVADEADRRGCAEVLLEVREDNPRARRLYLRNGFTEVGIRRGYYQPSGVDAVVMLKELR